MYTMLCKVDLTQSQSGRTEKSLPLPRIEARQSSHYTDRVSLIIRWGWEVLYHPPYSPDLSPCDFDLITKMKEPFRGIRFRTVPEILQSVDRSIRTINTTGAAKGILRLPHRWQRVVHNVGDYIEG
jgi:histone-lysine N-methyltransferase SETMAR